MSVEDESQNQQLFEYEASWRTLEDLGDLLTDCDGDPLPAAEAMNCQLAAPDSSRSDMQSHSWPLRIKSNNW